VALRSEADAFKALPLELRCLQTGMPVYTGEIEGRRLIVARSGVGKRNALEAAELVQSAFHPDAVISTGFCGGLVEEVRLCDVVLGSWVVQDGGRGEARRRPLLGDQAARLKSALVEGGHRVHVGGLVCVSRPVATPRERSELALRTGALAAEMETYHLAEYFLARRVFFVGLRTVVDCLEDLIPVALSGPESGGSPRLSNLLGFLASHPGAVGPLLRLYLNARKARGPLGKSVAAIVRVLP